ncbi:MAG: hypothetical protein Q7R39_10000 [Dehalococcoidia bacterium]|nr:hypothetical protein [Dehalococcoidia bacterium]
MNDPVAVKSRPAYILLAVVCFGVLGGLIGRRADPGAVSIAALQQLPPDTLRIAVFALGGLLYAWVGLGLLGRMLFVTNRSVRKRYGYVAFKGAIGAGFLMLFPFTILSAFAELYLGWNAVQAFAAAGIMTGAALAGMELGKLGGGRLAGAILPSLGGLVLSGLWMLITSLAQGGWRILL